jgi:hypothetical protein
MPTWHTTLAGHVASMRHHVTLCVWHKHVIYSTSMCHLDGAGMKAKGPGVGSSMSAVTQGPPASVRELVQWL